MRGWKPIIILSLGLLGASNGGPSNWQFIGSGDNFNAYVDNESIKDYDGIKRFTEVLLFTRPQVDKASGKSYIASLTYLIADCQKNIAYIQQLTPPPITLPPTSVMGAYKNMYAVLSQQNDEIKLASRTLRGL